jgi:hypothetical protein
MPTQKRIDWSPRIFNKLLIEMFTGDDPYISCEANNLVVVLEKSAIQSEKVNDTYIWVY